MGGLQLQFPTTVTLIHDQTESVDGDRDRQREGWPSESNGRPDRDMARNDDSAPKA